MLTHAHAQNILQAARDGRPVADIEWTALQRHLETCADCRAYAAALEDLERGLERRFQQELAQRWVAAQPRDLTRGVLERLRGEAITRRIAGVAGAVGALALLLGLIIGGGLLAPAASRAATSTPAAPIAASSTPTRQPELKDFHGSAVYESNHDGNREIYLVTAGLDSADDLTNNPANDTDPAWSPDGEWLAFLSDRTGKNEIYVMHISGAHLTQLTDASDIRWQAPLSWSYNGKLVAAVGVQALQPLPDGSGETSQSAVYVIPTVRGGLPGGQTPGLPTRLAYTAGASWARFSPALPLVAYISPTDGLGAYNVEALGYIGLTWYEVTKENMRPAANGEYDWAANGRALAYLSEDANNAWLRFTSDISVDNGVSYNSYYNFRANLEQSPGVARSVSYAPEQNAAVYLQEQAPGDGCWRLTVRWLFNASDPVQRAVYNGLCVTGRLARSNWTGDHLMSSWLVLAGHQPGETEESLWAAALPGRTGGELILRRLGDAPGLTGGPILRPILSGGERLAIDPPPAKMQENFDLSPIDVPTNEPGILVMAPWINNASGGITAMRPDGSGRTVLGAVKDKDATCPTLSPERKRIAFLSDRNSAERLVSEVFVMDADGSNVRQLTNPVYSVQKPNKPYDVWPLPRFSCPVWSPDGTMLAATVEVGSLGEVALIPVDGQGQVQRTSFYKYSSASPIWTPDSQAVLVYEWNARVSNHGITAILRAAPDSVNKLPLVEGHGDWFPVNMAFSPDGKTFAYMKLNLPNGGHSSLELILADYSRAADGNIRLTDARTVYQEQDYVVHSFIEGKLGWLADGHILLSLVRPTNAQVKVEFIAVDPTARQAATIWQTGEAVYSAVLSPDGHWLAFDAESGLYVLDTQPTGAAPRRIWDGVLLNLDWK